MAVSVAVSTDKSDYVIGEPIVAQVVVDGADPGSQKTVSLNAVATVDGIQIQSPPVTFSVTDPPAEIVVDEVVSDDPLIAFTRNPADQFVWESTAA